MSARKTLTSIVAGSMFALIGLAVVLHSARVQQSCASFIDFTDHPIEALTFVPAQEPEPSEFYGLDGEGYIWPFEGVGDNSPGCIPMSSVLANELETLLAAGGLLITAGMITFRRGSRKKLAASAISAGLAGSLSLAPSYLGDAIKYGLLPPAQLFATFACIVALCAILGHAGGSLGKRLDYAELP